MRTLISFILSIVFRIYRKILSLEKESERDKLSSLQLFVGEAQQSILNETTQRQIDWIRGALKRFPYWAFGHEALGKLALETRDLQTTHGSANALMLLGRENEGLRLLGISYVRAREGEKAVRVLSNLNRKYPNDTSVLEELGAAYMLGGENLKAMECLEKIPEAKRSLSVSAVIKKLSASHPC